jgi:anti-sigma factor RsiW
MAVNDNDLELLHEYLDGELPVSDCEGLWRRLAIERDLMSELDRLRADHAARTMVWSSLEPDDASVVRLEAKIMRATRRDDLMSWGSNALRILTSAAALILFGFTVGWLGRDRFTSGVSVVPHPSANTANFVTAGSGGEGGGSKIDVTIYDRNGKPIGPIQEFDSLDEAKQFVHDVQTPQASPGGDLNVVPTINKF